ncbi:MAG: EVE domain-containing protein [Magnetovibrio sp.]|nr:EVE domain-containing protein [Magnetovibrio sp.]
MSKWLVKSEPGCWSWNDHVKVGTEPWDGVRNHQAANYMKDMQTGDQAFFYHSVNEKKIVGILEVVNEFYIDPTDPKGKFVCVDFKALYPVNTPVSLADIKTNPKLENMVLLRQSRLSVMPVAEQEWDEIVHMAGGLNT